jgi:preprotein translocase subunit SecD
MAVRASSRNVREGIVSGLIGAALVAVWLLIYHAAH